MTKLQRIAEAMGLTPGTTGLLVAPHLRHGCWELHGCVGGPHALPGATMQHNSREAIAAAEKALAEELAERDAAVRNE